MKSIASPSYSPHQWSAARRRTASDLMVQVLTINDGARHPSSGYASSRPTGARSAARPAKRSDSESADPPAATGTSLPKQTGRSHEIRALRSTLLQGENPDDGLDPAEGCEGAPGEVADDGLVEFAACEPAHLVDLVPVGCHGHFGSQARAVDDADVGALVAVGVGEAELGAADGADQASEFDLGTDFLPSLATRCVLGCLVLVYRATDGAVGPEVSLAD